MTTAKQKARQFLEEEQAFRLGMILTETFHPKTMTLSQMAERDLPAAVRSLQSVDDDISAVSEKALQSEVFQKLIREMAGAVENGHRIIFTGCGATGRLSILLDGAWRKFWLGLMREHPDIGLKISGMEERVVSVMAGGDFALIKSVEGFEDFSDFGRYQLRQAGVAAGDVVVTITEGGETPFVIGTAHEGVKAGAKAFFAYNNPTELLREHIERSREVIDDERVEKIDLTTGPMAIAGSTRMQAVTMELFVIGAALETALVHILRSRLSESEMTVLNVREMSPGEYQAEFERLLAVLKNEKTIDTLTRWIECEEQVYRAGGLVTYLTDEYLLDIMTDTTERSPTFMLPPFRKADDEVSPPSWAFVKNPFRTTPKAWENMLQRPLGGLDWGADDYRSMGAPESICRQPPVLNNDEIEKFQIGNEPADYRAASPASILLTIKTTDDSDELLEKGGTLYGVPYRHTGVVYIGCRSKGGADQGTLEFPEVLPDSPLRLWKRLAVKLIFNTVSTATMVRMGRVTGNGMTWVSPSNKKLVDRGIRLVSEVTGYSYEKACFALFEAIEEVEQQRLRHEAVVSPVALAIKRIRKSAT